MLVEQVSLQKGSPSGWWPNPGLVNNFKAFSDPKCGKNQVKVNIGWFALSRVLDVNVFILFHGIISLDFILLVTDTNGYNHPSYDGINMIVKVLSWWGKAWVFVWRYFLQLDDPTPPFWTAEAKTRIEELGLHQLIVSISCCIIGRLFISVIGFNYLEGVLNAR